MRQADTQALISFLSATSDITLALDDAGVIRRVALGPLEQPLEESRSWLGQVWAETVTVESRAGILDMLREAATDGVSRRRQVNHPSPSGADIPVTYAVAKLGSGGNPLIAVGHDLRGLSALQRRLVEAQQSLERDYWRMRHIETRYRLLFQVSSDAILILDATTQKVVEANPASAELFEVAAKRLIGRHFPFDLEAATGAAVQELLTAVRAHGRGDDLTFQLRAGGPMVTVSVSLIRQDDAALFLVRLMPQTRHAMTGGSEHTARSLRLMEALPDAFVTIDGEGHLLSANRAFLDLAQMATLDQVRGQPLGRWLGRPGADMHLVLAQLREHGVVRLFGTSLRGELGSACEVEVSGTIMPDGTKGSLGLLIRDVGRRLAAGPSGARDLTRAVEQLTALVGRVSLKNLVRDTADLVERHFIEAALVTTGDNRTSAAEVLGVSRQSLYVKLRQLKIGTEPVVGRVAKASKSRTPRRKRR